MYLHYLYWKSLNLNLSAVTAYYNRWYLQQLQMMVIWWFHSFLEYLLSLLHPTLDDCALASFDFLLVWWNFVVCTLNNGFRQPLVGHSFSFSYKVFTWQTAFWRPKKQNRHICQQLHDCVRVNPSLIWRSVNPFFRIFSKLGMEVKQSKKTCLLKISYF